MYCNYVSLDIARVLMEHEGLMLTCNRICYANCIDNVFISSESDLSASSRKANFCQLAVRRHIIFHITSLTIYI